MLTEEQVAAFRRDGFVKGSQVLSAAEVKALRAETERVIAERDLPGSAKPVLLRNMGSEGAPVWQIVDIWMASEPFRRLVFNPVIAEEIAQLSEASTIRLWHDQIQFKPAAIGGVNHWHQDAPYWPILRPMTQVTAWVALDDADPENGCMSMVPGSHLWGNQIRRLQVIEEFDAMPNELDGHAVSVVTCPVRKGEVHYHHALTWHGSQSNRSGRPRRAIALHTMGDDSRYVESGDHPMKPWVTIADGEVLEGDAFPVIWPLSGG